MLFALYNYQEAIYLINNKGLTKAKDFSLAFLKKAFSHVLYALPFVPNKQVLTKYKGGKIFLNLSESPMMCSRALNAYEYRKVQFFENILQEGMTFLDIGANRGYYTLLAAKLMNDTGNILAFEPNPYNYYWLNKAVEANTYTSIKTFALALSDKNGEESMFLNDNRSGNCSLINKKGENCKRMDVKARTLDSIFGEMKIKNIDMIKIDVEGAELSVLKGAQQTLSEIRDLMLLIEVHSNVNKNHLHSFLEKCGFSTIWNREIKLGGILGRKCSETYAWK